MSPVSNPKTALRAIKRLRYLLLVARIPFVQSIFRARIYFLAKGCAADFPGAVVNLIIAELLRSKNPKKSMFLLNTLNLLPAEIVETNPTLIDFTRHLPGSKIALKLLTCRIVLERCFAGLDFDAGNAPEAGLADLIATYEGREINMKWLESLHGSAIWSSARRYLDRDPVLLQPDSELVSRVRERSASGDPEAMYMYGLACLHGYGTQQDQGEGIRQLAKSATLGYANAQATMGYLHYLGHFVERDKARGESFLVAAKAKGSQEAARALDSIAAEKTS